MLEFFQGAGVLFVERRYGMTRMVACLAMGAACAAMGCAQIAGIGDTRERADSGLPAIDAGLPAIDAGLPAIDASLSICGPSLLGADSCQGTLIAHIPLVYETATYGYLDVYYNYDTGINCAMTRAAGSVQGNASWIKVELRRCTETEPGDVCTEDAVVRDCGAYGFYAGPVSLEAPGQCINARGTLTYDGQTATATTDVADYCNL